jgi:hypothetical protein
VLLLSPVKYINNYLFFLVAFGLFYSIKQIVTDEYSSLISVTWYSCVALTADLVAVVLIAGSMCWSLYRKKIGFARQARLFGIYAVGIAEEHAQK